MESAITGFGPNRRSIRPPMKAATIADTAPTTPKVPIWMIDHPKTPEA